MITSKSQAEIAVTSAGTKMTKMFDRDFDPLTALHRVIEQNQLQAQQIEELQRYLEQASVLLNQHSVLIRQITEQNTEILLLWANSGLNLQDK
jgi:hypothetical protein